MKNSIHSRLMLAIFGLMSLGIGAQSAHAATGAISPLGIAIFAPVQLPSEEFTITGIQIDAGYGIVQDVYGLNVGIANRTTHTMGGIQAGVLNINGGDVTGVGLQFGGIGNFNATKANVYGLQAGFINSNKGESFVLGLDVAAVNLTAFTKVAGIQAGIYNDAGTVYGLQVGLINRVQMLHGIQIGLLNFNVHGLFAVAPILNVGF